MDRYTFKIMCRMTTDGTMGRWFPVWTADFHDASGADCAEYLRKLVISEINLDGLPNKVAREYKMIYEKR